MAPNPEPDTPDRDDEPEPVVDYDLFEAAGRALVTPREPADDWRFSQDDD